MQFGQQAAAQTAVVSHGNCRISALKKSAGNELFDELVILEYKYQFVESIRFMD
jgi:hypothetical protein